MTDETDAKENTDPIAMANLLIRCLKDDARENGLHREVLGYTLINLGCKSLAQLDWAIRAARMEWDV